MASDRGSLLQKTMPSSNPHARYFLSRHTYCCECHDGAVILDLKKNAYLSIDAESLRLVKSLVGDWPRTETIAANSPTNCTASTETLIRDLLAREILTTYKTNRPFRVECVPRAASTATSRGAPSAGFLLQSLASFVAAFVITLQRRRRGIAAWLDATYESRMSSRENVRETSRYLSQLLGSYFTCRIFFYTAHQHCLFDSLVLSTYLWRAGIPVTLVIGVSTRPFVAHSWVQFGELVLNDTAEHVQSFIPILGLN